MKKILAISGVIIALAALAGIVSFISERGSEEHDEKSRHQGVYARFLKRPMDCFIASGSLLVLSPVLVALTVIGAIKMKGNPFFVYPRAGKNGKVFNLIKFRTMANLKDDNGNFLPDEQRLTSYGRLLRSTSLDELPELINIVRGDMALIGPRPLTYKYLDYYTEEEMHRHDVRPGLTGLAQVNGRNAISWEERFRFDLEYIQHVSLVNDLRIILLTIEKVLKRADIGEGNASIQSLHELRAKK